MSKKHYQVIARALYRVRVEDTDHTSEGRGALTLAVAAVADVLAADNPRFDRARFVEACETGGCAGMPAPPPCAQAMGCLCARHARGKRTWRQPCDTREGGR